MVFINRTQKQIIMFYSIFKRANNHISIKTVINIAVEVKKLVELKQKTKNQTF